MHSQGDDGTENRKNPHHRKLSSLLLSFRQRVIHYEPRGPNIESHRDGKNSKREDDFHDR